MLLAARRRQYPRPVRQRRLMPDMLAMTTGQIRNPVTVLILMVAYNRLVHISVSVAALQDRFSNGRSGRTADGI